MTRQWFGEYEIVKKLRVGGMATLYLARRHGHAGFARLVALKMIHAHLVERPSFIEMFVDEARICSQISHPNVVHVDEFGVVDDVHYLVMDYIDGCSMSDLLFVHHRDRRKLDPELAARIIMEVAAGLHAAHESRDVEGEPLDVVHRDISPSNILLSTDGNAKLIDFGIAKARNRLTDTQAGITLKGKYNYVAPEQATRARVDRRCDIFSLGVVFWELLVNKPLFPEDTYVSLANRLARTEVAPPSARNPAVPPVFDALVLAMLQHDPADRPQTAAEVQRRIAQSVPGAANRDPIELGALAVDVRDKRAAQRALVEPASVHSQAGFSSAPRPRSPSEARVEHERSAVFVLHELSQHGASVPAAHESSSLGSRRLSTPGSRPGAPPQPRTGTQSGSHPRSHPDPGTDEHAGSPPGSHPGTGTRTSSQPAPRWRRAYIGLAALSGIGVVIGLVLARGDRSTVVPHGDTARIELADIVPLPSVAPLTMPSGAPPMPSSATSAPSGAAVTTSDATSAASAQPDVTPTIVRETPRMPPIVLPPPELTTTARTPTGLTRGPVRPPAQPIQRNREHVVIKPAASPTKTDAPPRAPEARTTWVPGAHSPFSSVRFDDAGNPHPPAPTPAPPASADATKAPRFPDP